MSKETSQEYWADVDAIAKEVLEECDDDSAYDRIHEDVDGSQWIIYTHLSRKVIEFTDNEEAWEDFGTDAFAGKDYNGITTFVAYCAMHADVLQKYQELKQEKEEAADEEEEG